MSPIALHTPSFMQPVIGDAAINDSAQEFRQFARAGLTAADGPGGTQGVTGASSFAVTQRGAGANFSVDVSSGLAYVVGDDVSGQGTYVCWNDATVNVATPSPPGSGTDVYRLVLQVQDKLNNGTWTGYTAALTLLPNAAGGGSTPPAEPNSAITLAFISIATGQVSVQNANITDYRQKVGQVAAVKASDTARASTTTLTNDPDLQLLNLAAGASYVVDGAMFYTAANAPGDLAWNFVPSAGSGGAYGVVVGNFVTGGFGGFGGLPWTTGKQAGGSGTGIGNEQVVNVSGLLTTGNAPASLILQWAQNSSSGSATTMRAGSFLRARRAT